MKKTIRKLLCLLLCITMFVCALPIQVFAMEVSFEDESDLSSFLNDVVTNDDISKQISQFIIDYNKQYEKTFKTLNNLMKGGNGLSQQLNGISNQLTDISGSLSQAGLLMNAMQYFSFAATAVSGIMSILKMTGVIEDPTMGMLNTILDAVNAIKAEVEEINKKVTQLQDTLNHEFANTEFKLDQIRAGQLLESWSDFIGNEYKAMTDLFDEYEYQINQSSIDWAKTWKNAPKTDLRCLYNKDGILLYSCDNYEGFDAALPAAPGSSDDASSDKLDTEVAFEIVLPAKYLSVSSKTTLNADNVVEIIRTSVLTAVKDAVKAGDIKVDAKDLTFWKSLNIETADDINAKIADDMVNSIFYEISSRFVNSTGTQTSFANRVLAAYKGFCAKVLGENGVSSALDNIIEYLTMTCAFEGDAKDIAYQYYILVQLAVIQYGSFTSTVVAMSPSIKTADKVELEELISATMSRCTSSYEGFLTGSDNYCYPLHGFLSYVDVDAEYVIRTHNYNQLAEDDEFSDFAIVDASIDFDTEDFDTYVYQTKINEANLKKSMVSARNLAYLYHYFCTSNSGLTILDYLKENGVITTEGQHSTTLLTPEYEVEEQPVTQDTLKVKAILPLPKSVEIYKDDKFVTPLPYENDFTHFHDRLIGKTFSIDGSATAGSGTASREKNENVLGIRVYQVLPSVRAMAQYLLHDEANITVSLSEEPLESESDAVYECIYTVKAEKSYGALVLNYDKDGDSYSYDETIKDKDGFIKFLKNIASGNTYKGKNILLDADIDMAGTDPESYWPGNEYKSEFRGHFNGGNKTISNFTFDTSDSRAALFRTTGDGAVIENLKFVNVNIGSGGGRYSNAALVGFANGDLKVINVEIVSGSIMGKKYVGGIVGESNEDKKLILMNCTNNAPISSSDTDAGGMLGNVGEFYIVGCVNNGDVTALRGGAGGMCGYTNKHASVKNSKNTGEITGYDCAGGMCGRVESDSKFAKYTANENSGSITAMSKGSAGGIVGWTDGGGSFVENTNSGDVECRATEKTHCAGGILGGNEDDAILFRDNTNSGSVTGNDRAGGIAGYLGDKDHDKIVIAKNNKNSGTILSTDKDAGGIFGIIGTDNAHHQVIGNVNTGSVTGKACTGGIVGWIAGDCLFDSNESRANILSEEDNAGGIVGKIEDDKCDFRASKVEGQVIIGDASAASGENYTIRAKKSNMHAGKLCGWDGKKKAPVNNDTLFASIFSEGSTVIILVMAAILIAAAVIIFVIYKKKKNTKTPKAA